MRVLVIAPHPDDEVLGCGGTMAKLRAKGHSVCVAIMTKGSQPLFSEEYVAVSRKEAQAAHNLLGVNETIFCDLPAAALDRTGHSVINDKIHMLLQQIQPEILFVPFLGDIHLDHQYIFMSSLVAARPNSANFPKKILAYETLSETNWNASYLTPTFQPNVYFDISQELEKKLSAFSYYQNQIKTFPHERSLVALEALAKLRGATVFCHAAEAFVLVREVLYE